MGSTGPGWFQLRALAQHCEAVRQQQEIPENYNRRNRASHRREDEQEHPGRRAFNSGIETVGSLVRGVRQQWEKKPAA